MRTASLLLVGMLIPIGLTDRTAPSARPSVATTQAPSEHQANGVTVRVPAAVDEVPFAMPVSVTPTRQDTSEPVHKPTGNESNPDRQTANNDHLDDDAGAGRDPSATDEAFEEASFTPLRETPVAAHLPEPVCAPGTTPSELTAFFDLGDPLLGADYQRAFALPDGRVLWLLQDAFLATSHGPELVHNVGLLQSGPCFQLLSNGSAEEPTPYLLAELTDPFDRWFWPLGGDVGDDGHLNVFVAELRERSSGYLAHTEPVATWLVSIELENLAVVDARPAPNPSNELYGWSVVSKDEYTYLYAHCYRQFGWDVFPFSDPPFRAHDRTCGPDVTVARIPRSKFGTTPEYWNGSVWTTDPAEAVPVIPRENRPINPAQVALFDGQFIAVTKVGDWWGDTIHLDVAPDANGPWQTYERVAIAAECDRCNTYFASIMPYGADETSFVVGVSSNTWPGDDLNHYTPTFLRMPAPPQARGRDPRVTVDAFDGFMANRAHRTAAPHPGMPAARSFSRLGMGALEVVRGGRLGLRWMVDSVD